jgi:hypothetical protein
MMKNVIRKILKEESDLEQNGNDIAVGLSHKAMNHLTDALRAIESALQYADDEELIDGLESISDNIINVLGDLIADNSQDNYNFNLNGPGPKAPEGEF